MAGMNEGLPLSLLERLKQVTNLTEMIGRLRARNYPKPPLDSAVLDGDYTSPPPGHRCGPRLAHGPHAGREGR